MLQVIIGIMAAGAYLTGKYVAKKEFTEEKESLKKEVDLYKRKANRLMEENWKLANNKYNEIQDYWEAESEFYKKEYHKEINKDIEINN